MGLLSKAAARIKARAPDEYAPVSKLSPELRNEIVKCCNTYTSVHGIVLACPRNYDEEKERETFIEQLNRVVSALGIAVPLSPRYCLVLFSNTVDRELLAHRLSKTMETEAPVVFQADNLNAVVEYIRPFL
jgi:hypothetical protein